MAGDTGGGPNLLDAVLVLLLVVVAARGWRQGAVSQLAALGGFVLGLVVGAWAAPQVAAVLVREPGPATAAVTLVVLLVVLLIASGAGAAAGLRVRRAAVRVGAGRADRVAGVGVGAAGLVLGVWLLSAVLAQGPVPAVAQQVRASQAVQALDAVLPPPPAVVGRIAAYLDEQGFPQVFAGAGRGIVVPPVPATADAAVRAAAAAGGPSTVQIRASGCGGVLGTGSGFVVRPGFVVTNAHVVAGFERLTVADAAGTHPATAVHVDPALDIAVLAAPGATGPAIGWADAPATRGTEGASLGFPRRPVGAGGAAGHRASPDRRGGPRHLRRRDRPPGRARPLGAGRAGRLRGTVRHRGRPGAGVVFAGAPEGGTGYALAADQVRPEVDAAITRNEEVGVGACRF